MGFEPMVRSRESLLAKAANSAGLTLHRAIDVSADPLQTYRDAAALGIDTVLTSGAAASSSSTFPLMW